jgi:hypothetical protein
MTLNPKPQTLNPKLYNRTCEEAQAHLAYLIANDEGEGGGGAGGGAGGGRGDERVGCGSGGAGGHVDVEASAKAGEGLLPAFDRLVMEVVLPHLKRRLLACGAILRDDSGEGERMGRGGGGGGGGVGMGQGGSGRHGGAASLAAETPSSTPLASCHRHPPPQLSCVPADNDGARQHAGSQPRPPHPTQPLQPLQPLLPLAAALDVEGRPGLVPLGCEGSDADGHSRLIRFWYQRPPTLRIQPGPSSRHVRAHHDAEYGHQEPRP